MRKLTEALETHAFEVSRHDTAPETNNLPLVVAAKEWAAHSLDTYADKLLRKALAISVALREFADEYEGQLK